MSASAQIYGPRPVDPYWGYHRKDWIDLCEDLKDRDKTVYGVLRALVYDNQRTGERGDVRKISLNTLCALIPGVNGKPTSLGGLRDSLRRLTGVGLISEPHGANNIHDRALTTSSSPKAAERDLKLRVHDVPWNNYRPTWRNVEEKVKSLLNAPGPAATGSGWESNQDAPGEGSGWDANQSGWDANQPGWNANHDTPSDQGKLDPLGCSSSAASTQRDNASDDSVDEGEFSGGPQAPSGYTPPIVAADEHTDPASTDAGWAPDEEWVRHWLPEGTVVSVPMMEQVLSRIGELLAQGMDSIQVSKVLASNPKTKAAQRFLQRTHTVASAQQAADQARDLPGMRPDVDRVCDHLVSALQREGLNTPAISVAWRREVRLMLDHDHALQKKIDAPGIVGVIDWMFGPHSWWRGKVTSPGGLRRNFEKIAQEARDHYKNQGAPTRTTVAQRNAEALRPEDLHTMASRKRSNVDADYYGRALELAQADGRVEVFHAQHREATVVWFAGFCQAGGMDARALPVDVRMDLEKVYADLVPEHPQSYQEGLRVGHQWSALREHPE